MKELLIKLNACNEAREWASNKSIDEIWATCHRCDWMLWLARKLNIDTVAGISLTYAESLIAEGKKRNHI